MAESDDDLPGCGPIAFLLNIACVVLAICGIIGCAGLGIGWKVMKMIGGTP